MLAAASQAPAQRKKKPNLVLLFADDLGYGDIASYGSPDVPTPNIDSIGRNGVRFTDGYVSAAVCSPSRAALLTGRYQHRFGHEFNSGPPEREAEVGFGLPAEARIFPQYLKQAGYASAAIGKWHLGVRPGYHPLERGFDEFFGFLPGANDYVTEATTGGKAVDSGEFTAEIPPRRSKPILRGRKPVDEDRYLTDAFAAEAASFISRNREKPFFLYLAFNAVHTPLHATEKYLDRFANIENDRHRYLAAMTASMDDAVGAVLRSVRQSGLEDDTMIVFLSDNGCPEMTGAGTNGPLAGEKVTYYEGGIRVPFMMQWKGRIPAGRTYTQPVVSRDILPTFLAAAGLTAPTHFDGVDLMPHVTGKTSRAPHDFLFWRAGSARAVRKGNWKLLEFGDSFTRLFDLSKDIGETQDLAAKFPDVVRDLRAAHGGWSATMKKAAWPPRYREITVNGTRLNWEL
jgi:arylsulfatase A-like enzyme